MENEKIERIKNPKLSAGRIPDLLKASIMESQKKLTLVQKKDVITLHLQFKDLGYKKLSQLVLHQDHSTNPVDNQYRNQLYQNNQSEDVVLELVPVRDSSTSPAPKMLI